MQTMAAPFIPGAYNPGAHNPVTSMTIPAPVSSAFCVPYVAQFVIDQKVLTLSSGRFTINDAQGALLFEVQGKKPLAMHTRRVLKDASGNVLVLMKKKIMTVHDRWAAYRGNDDSDSNLLFTMLKSSVIQFKPSFEVFLAGNDSGTPDFTVKGDFFQHSYSILYNGVPIAEVSKKINAASIFIGKDQYGVTVYPGVDHAFIGAVIVIVDQVKQDDAKGSGGSSWDFSGFTG